jgi:hypothetical protein
MAASQSEEKWYDKWMWYEKDTPKEEKTLLRKLDFMILTFGCLTFFTKVGDSIQINGAELYLLDFSSWIFRPFKMPTFLA